MIFGNMQAFYAKIAYFVFEKDAKIAYFRCTFLKGKITAWAEPRFSKRKSKGQRKSLSFCI